MSFNNTILEYDGQLLNFEEGYNFLENHPEIPQVQFTLDNIGRPATSENSAKSAFLERNETLKEKLISSWKTQGLYGVLNEVSNEDNKKMPTPLKKICRYMTITLDWLSTNSERWFQTHQKMSCSELASQLSPNNNWETSSVRLLSWHPHANKLAVALIDDSIRVFYHDNELVPVLKHKMQRKVTCVEWKPMCSSLIAIACQNCVILWTVDPCSLLTRPYTSCVQIIDCSQHHPVTGIAWNPRGFDQLFAVSALGSQVVAWETSTQSHQVLASLGGGVTGIFPSPDGTKVAMATWSSLRVYETSTWSYEKWEKLQSRVQTACWTPNGANLLFSLHGGDKIFCITFAEPESQDGMVPKIEGAKVASLAIDLSHLTEENETEGNLIHSMKMSTSGDRLAILLGRNHKKGVVLYATSYNPIFTATPRGFVPAPENSVPSFITFKPSFEDGALLTMCTSQGEVLHTPLYFNNAKMNKSRIFNQSQINKSHYQTFTSAYNASLLDCSD